MEDTDSIEKLDKSKPGRRFKICVFIILPVLILLVLFGVSVLVLTLLGNNKPCTTKECVTSTSEVLRFIDEKINPCEDFYQFACGGYLKMAKQKGSISVYDDLIRTIDEDFYDMLNETSDTSDSYTTKLIKSLFQSCTDESLINDKGLNSMKSALSELGGWPVLEDKYWSEKSFKWTDIIKKMREIGIDYNIFFTVKYKKRQDDGSKRILTITNNIFQAFKDEDIAFKFMVETAVMFGANRNIAERDFRDVLKLHRKLVEVTNFKQFDERYSPSSLRDVEDLYRGIDWYDFLKGIVAPGKISRGDIVNVDYPYLLKTTVEVLTNSTKRKLANYLLWNVVFDNMIFLPEKIRNLAVAFNADNKISINSRMYTCGRFVEKSMISPHPPHISKYYSITKKIAIKHIFSDIKDEYKKAVDSIIWLNADSKILLNEKLDSITFDTLDGFLTEKINDHIYSKVPMNESDPLAIYLKLKAATENFRFQQQFSEIDFFNQYDAASNNFGSIEAQNVYFNEERPQYMNYGALGTAMSSYLSSIFFEGPNYDLTGLYIENVPKNGAYDDKLHCLYNQYRHFYDTVNLQVNTSATSKKDLADLISKDLAYKAYSSWLEKYSIEFPLPGIKYTQKQIFWIYSAICLCTTEDFNSNLIKFGWSPNHVRVNGPLQNLDDFSNDFYCDIGSSMNPKEKCN